MQIIAEVCVENRSGALSALKAGAHRIELCQALSVGGVTPSMGLLESVLEVGIPTIVLVRPRAGDFVYGESEVEVVARDIRAAVRAGAAGVAIGALTPTGEIDQPSLARWVECAEGREVCFHRAFDGVADPENALPLLPQLGVTRLLTTAGASDVVAGIARLKKWIDLAPPALTLMPGGGVRAENIQRVVHSTGASQIHFSARVQSESPVQFLNPESDLHGPAVQTRWQTNETEIRRFLDALSAN